MEKYGFVYIWYDRKRKMFYIGCHWGTEDDGYICSSRRMRDVYRRRPQDFRRRIVSRVYTNREDLLEEEHKWFQMIKPEELGKRYYNLRQHRWGHWTTDENKGLTIRQKISEASIRLYQNPEYIHPMYGKKHTEESREKMSRSKKGKIPSSAWSEGNIPWNKGKKRPEITGEKHPLYGKKHTEESREKMSESQKGRIPWNKGKKGLQHHTEESKKKLSKVWLGRKHSEESKEKMRLAIHNRRMKNDS